MNELIDKQNFRDKEMHKVNQIKQKRKDIIEGISELPTNKRKQIIKDLDELIGTALITYNPPNE